MAKGPGWQPGASLNMLDTWRERAEDVRGHAIDCGHFLPEEAPDETYAAIKAFITAEPAEYAEDKNDNS